MKLIQFGKPMKHLTKNESKVHNVLKTKSAEVCFSKEQELDFQPPSSIKNLLIWTPFNTTSLKQNLNIWK